MLQLGFRTELIAVEPSNPFGHQVHHELVVLLKIVYLWETLLGHAGKVKLVAMTIRAPDAAVLGVL